MHSYVIITLITGQHCHIIRMSWQAHRCVSAQVMQGRRPEHATASVQTYLSHRSHRYCHSQHCNGSQHS